ncbi:MAG: hypothetical protein J5580_02450 [Clostridia bacterium]|nr:hypothetical protein [Clostridia bacterium]
MQKEDLIKRLRLFAAVTTTAFIILIVALLVQFGFIAYYHQEINNLHHHNEALQQEIKDMESRIAYANGAEAEDEKTRNAGESNT